MVKFLSRMVIVFVSSIVLTGLCFESFAVDAPTVEQRQKGKDWHEKEIKKKAKEQRASGCTYGKDKVTGKCYEPKEGQVYRDPKTGKMKIKGVKKINTPW